MDSIGKSGKVKIFWQSTKANLRNQHEVAVAWGVSRDLVFAVGTSLLNFQEHHQDSEETISYFIYSNGWKKGDELPFSRMDLDITLYEYSPPIRPQTLLREKVFAYFTPLVLSKFEVLHQSKIFGTTVWLDYDIYIRAPILEALKNSRTGTLMSFMNGGKLEDAFIGQRIPHEDQHPKHLSFGMSAQIIVVSKTEPQQSSRWLSDLYSFVEKYPNRLYLPEQAAFNWLINQEGIAYEVIDRDIFGLHPKDSGPASLVEHCYGPKKFWSGEKHAGWESFFKKWLLLGGSSPPNHAARFYTKWTRGASLLAARMSQN